MPQQLKYIAQTAMDQFYQSYKGETDFFDLEDFITMGGNTIAAMYMDVYKQEYAMLRQDRKDEVVTFDIGWLCEQEVEIKKNGVGSYALLEKAVMAFPYDQSSAGLQNVFVTEPYYADELERITVSKLWEVKYWPKTNRVAFYADIGFSGCEQVTKIGFANKGECNLKKIRILYIPSMTDGDAIVADGIIGDAITKTVIAMKQMAGQLVVDKTADQNPNKIVQTELDKSTLTK